MYFLAEGDAKEDLAMFVQKVPAPLLARVLMYEFGPDYLSWGQDIPNLVKTVVHANHMRALAASTKFLPSVQAQQVHPGLV